MGMPLMYRKMIMKAKEAYDKDFKRSTNPGRSCVVYLTDAHPRYVAYTSNSIKTLRATVRDSPDVFVLYDRDEPILTVPVKGKIDVSELLDTLGFREVQTKRFPALIFAKFLAPLVRELREYDRVVFIDPDTRIVDPRFADVFSIDFEGHQALASYDPWFQRQSDVVVRKVNALGIRYDHPACARLQNNLDRTAYCNVGLIVWNMAAINTPEYADLVGAIVDLQTRAEFGLPEQDCFFCAIDVKPIPGCYNTLVDHCADITQGLMLHYTGTQRSKRLLTNMCRREGYDGMFDDSFALQAQPLLERPVQRWAKPDKPMLVGYFSGGPELPVESIFRPFKMETAFVNDPDQVGYDFAVAWDSGDFNLDKRVLEVAERDNCPLVLCEGGPVWSVCPWNMKDVPAVYRTGCSMVLDVQNFNYNASARSRIELTVSHFANCDKGTVEIEAAERGAAIREKIVRNRVSKYNHQPDSPKELLKLKEELASTGRRCVLVVDQDYADASVFLSGGIPGTFEKMLWDAVHENPGCTVLVKTHPIQIAGGLATTQGAFAGVKDGDTVRRIDYAVNPYTLFGLVDKVYVQSSAMGFEALMAGKEVHVYGMPWYAGWGLTHDAQPCERRQRFQEQPTLDELVYAYYCKYTLWCDPETRERIEAEQAIDRIIELRDRFRAQTNCSRP